MVCPKCNSNNMDGSTFCIKCGANLKEIELVNIEPNTVNQVNSNVSQPQGGQVNVVESKQSNNVDKSSLGYVSYIIGVLLKPVQNFRNNESKLNNPKTSFVFALLVSLAMTIINLVTTMINVAKPYYKGYDWDFDSLKDLDYLELIGKNFLIYLGVILAITIVFYIGSLIVKKNMSFIKSLAIATTSVIPAVICSMVLSPLGGMVWDKLSIVLTFLGFVYSIVILYELVNSELSLEGDVGVYYNASCFLLLAVAAYYVYVELFTVSSLGGLDGLLDWFG